MSETNFTITTILNFEPADLHNGFLIWLDEKVSPIWTETDTQFPENIYGCEDIKGQTLTSDVPDKVIIEVLNEIQEKCNRFNTDYFRILN